MLSRGYEYVVASSRSLWYAHGNNNTRKTIMLVFLVLFIVNAILVMVGRARLDDPNALALWSFLLSSFSFMWGQNTRDEVRRRRKHRGESDED